MTQGEAYKIYVDKFGKKVGFTSFRNLKPGNVRKISETDRRTCLCTICANVALKAHSIAKYAKLKSNDESSDNLVRLNKMSKEDLVSHTLCHKNGINEYHRVECINRTCPICGVDKLDELFRGLDLKENIEWYHWEHIQIKKK